MESCAYYECPLGTLEIRASEHAVTGIKLVPSASEDNTPTPLSELAFRQLSEYFTGSRTEFDLPLAPAGTCFQQSVWEALQGIPWGKTQTYGQIAAHIGKPGAARAVGAACKRNPIWIVIPCHRIIGQKDNLTGYAGGLAAKQALLDLEQSTK